MKIRVSSEAFAKKGAGAPRHKFRGPKVTHAQTNFYRQNLSSVDKSGPSLRGRQREREAPEEGEAGGGRGRGRTLQLKAEPSTRLRKKKPRRDIFAYSSTLCVFRC